EPFAAAVDAGDRRPPSPESDRGIASRALTKAELFPAKIVKPCKRVETLCLNRLNPAVKCRPWNRGPTTPSRRVPVSRNLLMRIFQHMTCSFRAWGITCGERSSLAGEKSV